MKQRPRPQIFPCHQLTGIYLEGKGLLERIAEITNYIEKTSTICLLFNNNKVLSDTQKEIIGMYFS